VPPRQGDRPRVRYAWTGITFPKGGRTCVADRVDALVDGRSQAAFLDQI
jgi:hypothetical protein